jgi:SAM-dependent methyltransferase
MNEPAVRRRGLFTGVTRIIQFNWPQYVVGAVAIGIGLTLTAVPGLPANLLLAGTALAAWWLVASLVASWWIYDLSPLSKWSWLVECSGETTSAPNHILNVHSGYDDTSAALAIIFPDSKLTVLDLFDANRMTEPSIRRARKAYPNHPGTLHGTFGNWPCPSSTFELVLLLMSAHEFRKPAEREALFDEARRILAPGGEIVVVEHLRNPWNFAAFGPGFMHFWPRAEWLRLAKCADLRVVREGRVTPFVGYFQLETKRGHC